MLPELFKIPILNLTVWSYGAILGLGAIAGLWLTGRLAERDGLPRNELLSAVLWCGPAVFIGSQIMTLIAEGWTLDWHEVLSPNRLHSGGTYYGALLAVLPASIILTRLLQLPWLQSLDTCAPGIALISAVGRLGCFAAGCCWGRATDSWMGVRFSERAHAMTGVPTDVALVPTQLLLAVAGLLIFAAVLWLRRRRAFAGQIILAYLILYSCARFVVEFWRDDPRGQMLGLSPSQLIAVVTLPLALMLYWRAWPTKRMGFKG
jgi:phosphatidylglycerol:prolipoprotein diacylglycerol transferase